MSFTKEELSKILKEYEPTIQTKKRFGWTQSYEEETPTTLNEKVFLPIVLEAFEALDWEVGYTEETAANAKRKNKWNKYTEKISVVYERGKVKVKSASIEGGLWDGGSNSKQVKLFIYALKKIEESYEQEELEALEEKVERANNWDDYEIPDNLPLPKKQKTPKIWIPIVGGVLLSVLLGGLLAFLTIKITYVIGLYEMGIGLLIGFAFKYLIKFSHYEQFKQLNYIVIGVILLLYLFNQYFIYELVIAENDIERFGFTEFIKFRFEQGLTLESLNLGGIGLVVSWGFQIWFTWLIAKSQIASVLIKQALEKVPMEVVDFAFYHFVKGKTEEEVRKELYKKGWMKEEEQDAVFQAIVTIRDLKELEKEE